MTVTDERPAAAGSAYKREELKVGGIKVEMLTAGKGEPLMFWHGAGTLGGWDWALPWAKRYKVMIPYHPGWGGSGDDPTVSSVQDFVMHYVELFDQLKLDKVNLVGLSMGGWIAATFASQHGHRLRKLALVAPAGLRVPEAPTLDFFKIKPEETLGYLMENIESMLPYLPKDPGDLDFILERFREATSFARVAWERAYDPKLARWLHRIGVPTLLVWGEQDKVVPFAQAKVWAKLIPGAKIASFKGAGHLVLNEKPEAVAAIAQFLG
jgi:pimeloyl-ACP methyl ester carboxylesterase